MSLLEKDAYINYQRIEDNWKSFAKGMSCISLVHPDGADKLI